MTCKKITLLKLHSEQAKIAVERDKLTAIRCGRRFGKTSLFETLACAIALNKDKSIGWFSPTFGYMIGSFRRIKRTLKPQISRYSSLEKLIELKTGSIIRFWSLENPDCGRGDRYDEVFIDEASLKAKGLRDIFEQSIYPTLLDTYGNAWLAGTPKGVDSDNFFYFACTNADPAAGQVWKEFHAPTSANPYISKKALAEFQKNLPPLVYQQEVLAEFVDWSGKAFFALQSMLIDGTPIAYPSNCDIIIVTIDTAIKDGKKNDCTAAVYGACSYKKKPYIALLDYDIIQLEGASLISWLPKVIEKAKFFSETCNARYGADIFIEDKASGIILLQQCRQLGINAKPINSHFTSMGKSSRAIEVSGFVYQNYIVFSKFCHEKTLQVKGITKNHLLTQVVGFRVGVSDQEDDLLDCFCYLIMIFEDKMKSLKIIH
jgi:hypothetical protein